LPNAVEYTAERDGWVFVSPYDANVSVKAAGIAVNGFLVDYFANRYLRTIKAPVATGDRVQIAVGPPEAWSCVFYPFIRGSG
jgi:hypothetical protein